MLDPARSKAATEPAERRPASKAAARGFLPARQSDRTGLYLHFPFCIQKCDYCDFFSLPLAGAGAFARNDRAVSAEFLSRYRAGIEEELSSRKADFHEFKKINTIYFGGGTSSLMPADFIAGLLELFRGETGFEPDAAGLEITLEGNPEDFTATYLSELQAIGVTRVNTGIQTFQRQSLESMNRYFDPERYERVLHDLDASPIANIGADLIYGLPGQSEADFYRDLDRLLQTRVNHLSLYSLTAEAGTAYANRIQSGGPAPDDELQTRIFRALPERLAASGFVQYEISNFAKPDAYCRHNLRYWYYESYLALGPGAHGFDGRRRYGNARNLEKWLADPLHAKLTNHDPTADIALNILRLTLPIPRVMIREIFNELNHRTPTEQIGTKLAAAFEAQLDRWVRLDLADWQGADAEFFQWRQAGLLQLDERVFEMSAALEAVE